MTRFKDFGTGDSSPNSEPISFKLYGEQFDCVPEIQGKVMLDLISDSTSEDPSRSSKAVVQLLEKVMIGESRERFSKLIESEDKIVSVETLSDIGAWLVEEYTNRPPQQSQES
jgi:hypothetical protein